MEIRVNGIAFDYSGPPLRYIPILEGESDHPMNFDDIYKIQCDISLEQAKEIAKNNPQITGWIRMRDSISLQSKNWNSEGFPSHPSQYYGLVMFKQSGNMGNGFVTDLHPGDVIFINRDDADWIVPLLKHGDCFYQV